MSEAVKTAGLRMWALESDRVQVPFLSLLSCSLSASFLTYQKIELLCSITVHLNELINEKHLEQ